jgi:hypothetical protein
MASRRLFQSAARSFSAFTVTSVARTAPSMVRQPATVTRAVVPSMFVRHGSGRPEKSEFEKRALELLKGFEKIDDNKVYNEIL